MTVVTPTDNDAGSASTGRPPVYLDFNATAPVDPRVAEEVLRFMSLRVRQRREPHPQLRPDRQAAGQRVRARRSPLSSPPSPTR